MPRPVLRLCVSSCRGSARPRTWSGLGLGLGLGVGVGVGLGLGLGVGVGVGSTPSLSLESAQSSCAPLEESKAW